MTQDSFLSFLTHRGFDLELRVASEMSGAGFIVGQSLGLTKWDPLPLDFRTVAQIEEHERKLADEPGREIDVVAMVAGNDTIAAFVIECKSLRAAELGVLVSEHDYMNPMPAEVVVQGRYRAHVRESVVSPPRLPVDARAFRMISKPLKEGSKEKDYDPSWNALRQVLDATDDAATLSDISEARYALVVPLIVTSAPIHAVELRDNQLHKTEISSAVVRVAAHKGRTHREVYVVTLAGLAAFAKKSMAEFEGFLHALEQQPGK